MGNNPVYRSKTPEINEIYDIYNKSFKEINKPKHNHYSKPEIKHIYSQLFESF